MGQLYLRPQHRPHSAVLVCTNGANRLLLLLTVDGSAAVSASCADDTAPQRNPYRFLERGRRCHSSHERGKHKKSEKKHCCGWAGNQCNHNNTENKLQTGKLSLHCPSATTGGPGKWHLPRKKETQPQNMTSSPKGDITHYTDRPDSDIIRTGIQDAVRLQSAFASSPPTIPHHIADT